MPIDAWELAQWDAVETIERLGRKEVTPLEVVEAAIARTQSLGKLNAVVTETHASARAKAGATVGPLAGVPTFIKDLAQVKGVRTAWGSASSGDFASKRNDPTVNQLEATGLVSLGKSATPEYGFIPSCEPLAFGATRNPWALEHTTGGSSGGAAALVASGAVPLAHGSDGGGSIRIPASCCGLVGLKPSRHRLDMEGSNLLPVNIAVHGVLSRTVRDTIAFWKAIDAQRPLKKRMLSGDLKPLTKRLKIGVFVDPPTKKAIDPEVAAAVMQAAKLLRELGHQVDEIACPVPEYVVEEFLSLWSWVSFAQPRSGLLARGKGFTLDKLEPWTHAFAERFKQRKWGVLREAYRLRRYTRDYVQHMAGYDVLLCPTTGEVAPKLGHLSPSVPFDEALARVLTFTPFAASFNASGVPAISLPLGQSAGKVPIGVHFAAGMNQEQLLLELALELEAARPWVKLAPRLQ